MFRSSQTYLITIRITGQRRLRRRRPGVVRKHLQWEQRMLNRHAP